MRRIPVMILGGFLGSGKTTLLLEMLNESKRLNLKYSVLINERGKVDIDGLVVSKKNDNLKIETLLDGCICCSKKSEIATSIDILLQKQPDIIFIELTGVANADEVAQTLTEKEIIAKVVLKSILIVVDSEFLLSKKSDHYKETIFHQLKSADVIIVNKMDLISKSDKQKSYNLVKNVNPTAELEFATYGEVESEQFLRKLLTLNNEGQSKLNQQSANMTFSNMTTTVLPVDGVLSKPAVENFILKHSDQIIRAKGFIPIKENNEEVSYLLQFSGVKRIEWKYESSSQYYLILIGLDLDSTVLKEEWSNEIKSYMNF